MQKIQQSIVVALVATTITYLLFAFAAGTIWWTQAPMGCGDFFNCFTFERALGRFLLGVVFLTSIITPFISETK